tara:strand:+ start:733 stop:1314 length:582 start_codon:yes stop_codon:yes gene_type:complete
MLMAKASSSDKVGAAITRTVESKEKVSAGGVFTVQCIGADGQVKWQESLKNLVVNQGLQDMNTKYFKGSAYTAAWYIGLYGAAASNDPTAADTAASHPGFTEIVPYSNATRPAATFGTATTADPSVISNSASPAVYTINSTSTVGGAFLISDNTKSGTAGVLFSASDFAAPGDRAVSNGDTINITYTFSLDAA